LDLKEGFDRVGLKGRRWGIEAPHPEINDISRPVYHLADLSQQISESYLKR